MKTVKAMGSDGHVYTNPTVVKFVKECLAQGWEVKHYRGRFFWEGPCVFTSRRNGPSMEEIVEVVDCKLQHDSMGMDFVVYPRVSDKGILPEGEE